MAAFILILLFWGIMSRIYSPLVVPPIGMVAEKVVFILSSAKLWTEIGKTLTRMATGLGVGVLIGCVTGLVGGIFSPFCEIWKPILGIVQVVPPISWLILAIIWFGFNGSASIFIVVMAVVPTMFICICDGINSIDRKLMEMGTVFGFSPLKKLRYILIPSIAPYFCSGLKIAVGMACKTVVMGEVLTTTSGIGGQIMTARLNIEPETVIAWTVVITGIYYVAVICGKCLVLAGRRMRVWRSLMRTKEKTEEEKCWM